MSVLPKPTPEKHCSYCGKKMERQRYKSKLEDLGAFMRRKYCCRECMRKGFIKSGEVTDQDIKAAHASSRKIPFTIQGKERRCEMCGRPLKNLDMRVQALPPPAIRPVRHSAATSGNMLTNIFRTMFIPDQPENNNSHPKQLTTFDL